MDAEGVGIVEVGLAGAKFVDARDGALVIVEVDSLLTDVDDDTGSVGAGLSVMSGRSARQHTWNQRDTWHDDAEVRAP